MANRKKKGSRGGCPVTFDAGLYRDRNTVERMINRLKFLLRSGELFRPSEG